MKIRPAKKEELPALKKLLYETWIATYGHFVPTDVLTEVTSVWHAPEKLAAELASGHIWLVAETHDGAPAALLTARWSTPESIALDRLYVHPKFQRRGFGRKLFEALLASCPTAKWMNLEVEEFNPGAREFYRKLGFMEGSRVRQDLGRIEAYVFHMTKTLA